MFIIFALIYNIIVMAIKVAIASGKGGAGKTMLSTNLASYIAQSENVLLGDIDVEEPNSALFFNLNQLALLPQYRAVPQWHKESCTLCSKCVSICKFNALAQIESEILVYNKLCHSCYACSELCPAGALPMKNQKMGTIRVASKGLLLLLEGRLNVDEEQAVPLINEVHSLSDKYCDSYNYHLFDSPPGTSCSMIAAIEPCDVVLFVTEPSPFGLNDLELAVEAAALLKKRMAVIINKYGSDVVDIEGWCNRNRIETIAKIPFDLSYANRYSKGELLINDKIFSSIMAVIYNYLKNIEGELKNN